MFNESSLSIRERLIDKNIFHAYMISKINQDLEETKKIQTIEEIGLKW